MLKKLQLQSIGRANGGPTFYRASKKPNYDSWPKEQLITEVEHLHRRKKYGLVWEDKSENVVEQCKKELPVLKEIRNKTVQDSQETPTNILIEGDNYHALSVLNYTHKKSIDLIYIDPPYNTGARNWKYNNDYVDKDDAYRHSKWLSLMEHRLTIAKNLLKEDGVLICAIDENEQAHLSVLLEEIFSAHEQHTITVVHNPKGVQGMNFSHTNEYAIFVVPKNRKVVGDRILNESEIYISNLRNWGNESLRTDAKNCFYPIVVSEDKIVGFGEVAPSNFHPKSANEKQNDGTVYVWPIDEKGVERKWRYARQSVEEIKEILQIKRAIKGIVQIMIAKDYGTYKTVWVDKRYDASEYGTKLLREIIPNCDFDFPKSLYTVYDCLFSVVGNRPSAQILDFFAGSGTTGHAVLELNKQDGGNRRFILCTNNENNIATDICYPRVTKAIKGYKNSKGEVVAGLGGNLKYFRTAFVGAEPNDKNKEALTRQATEMLCMHEDTFELVEEMNAVKIFKNSKYYTGIIFDEDAIPILKKYITKLGGAWSVYIFSFGNDTFDEEFEDMEQKIKVSPIPEAILRVYRRLFQA